MSKDRIKSSVNNLVELKFLEKVSARLPEDIEVLQALAELYTRNEHYKEGLLIDQKLSRRLPNDELVWYNLGCSYSLVGEVDKAFEALAKAVDLGYDDYDWMKSDSDLNSLHDDPRFESLLSWLYTAFREEEQPGS